MFQQFKSSNFQKKKSIYLCLETSTPRFMIGAAYKGIRWSKQVVEGRGRVVIQRVGDWRKSKCNDEKVAYYIVCWVWGGSEKAKMMRPWKKSQQILEHMAHVIKWSTINKQFTPKMARLKYENSLPCSQRSFENV